MDRISFLTLLFFLLIPFSAHASSFPSIHDLPAGMTAEQVVAEEQKVATCVQDVYNKETAHEPIEGGFMVALKNCYKGTILEQYAQFPTEQKTHVDVSQYKDFFSDPRAAIDLQKAFDSIPRDLTVEESQKVAACFETLQSKYTLAGPPSAEVQHEFAHCFRGTSYEPIADVYDKIADRVDCANDSLGAQRVLAVVGRQDATPHEIAIVQQCIIERATKAATGIAALNIFLGLGPTNSWLLVYFLVTQPFLAGLYRKTNTWGLVKNSATNRPVDLALVRILREGRVAATRVTDVAGRYVFLVPPAAYTLEVNKPRFKFPSFLMKSPPEISAEQGIVNLELPIDPQMQEKSAVALRWEKIRYGTHANLARISPLATIGAAFLDPKWWVIVCAVVTTVFFIVFRTRIAHRAPTKFGAVIDAATKKPVAGAVVRIFSLPYQKLADSQLTDAHGRYAFLVGPGTYELTAEKSGFTKTISPEITVTATEGWIDQALALAH